MAKLTDFLGRPHSGIVPHAVIGIVTENEDPDKLGRVKVKFPSLEGEPTSTWIRVATAHSSATAIDGSNPFGGFWSPPEVGAEVLVLFVQGSQDVGVVIGQLYNGKDIPPDEADLGCNGTAVSGEGGDPSSTTTGQFTNGRATRQVWVSRGGHVICMDDNGSDNKGRLELWDSSRQLGIILDTEAKTVFVFATENIVMRASKDITFQAGGKMLIKTADTFDIDATGDATIKSQGNIKGEATSNVELKATSSMKLEGTAGFEAKGATAKVSGDATAELSSGGGGKVAISGPAVAIN